MPAADQAQQVLSVLERATGLLGQTTPDGTAYPSGRPFFSSAYVKFPAKWARCAERVGMWVDGETLRLAVWPAELQPQYRRVYSDPSRVEGLIALGEDADWELLPNFHIAYRFARPPQRWYPTRQLDGRTYVRQWIDDLREGHAGGRTRDQLSDPGFRRWLVERGYAPEDELSTLDDWFATLAPGIRFHIRPGAEITRAWQRTPEAATGDLVADVRAAITRIVGALGDLGD